MGGKESITGPYGRSGPRWTENRQAMPEPTPRELVLAALRHEETERLPYNFMLSPPALGKLQAHLGLAAHEAADWIGSCLYIYGCRDKPLYAHPDRYGPTISDQWGVVWATSEVDRGYPVVHPLAGGIAALPETSPDPLEPKRWEGVAQSAERHPDLYRLAVIGDLWERANFLRGLDRLLLDLLDQPRFVHELLDRIAEYDLATLRGMVPFQPDGVFLSDDYGLQRSLMMSPRAWREFIRPRLKLLFDEAKRHGFTIMLHSCGHVSEIVPDLIELGLDILHPIQPEAMDILRLKREFGRDITFCGGLNTQQLLPCGTPEEVRAEVLRLGDDMGRGGGYIIEPGITVQADVPLGNLLAAITAAREYRRRRA
jgi:uroporphyrinogen decarboxylase